MQARILRKASHVAVFFLLAPSLRAEFTTIVNAPPEVPKDNVVRAGTQLNVFEGAVFDEGIGVSSNAEVNIYGGKIEFFVEPSGRTGDLPSRINFYGGKLNGGIYAASPNGITNIYGGDIEHVHAWGGRISMHGGVTNGFVYEGTSPAIITGGKNTGGLSINTPGKARISGGTIDGTFVVYDSTEDDYRAEVELVGRKFMIDGNDVTSTLLPNIPFMIEQRDVNLSGMLADGSEFSIDLNSNSSRDSDHVSRFADLSIILIPEPSTVSILLAGIACLAAFRKVRLRSQAVHYS